MVDTGVHQNLPEPTLQRRRYLLVPVVLELAHVLEQFYKPFIHNFFNIFRAVNVPVTNAHSILLQQIVHLLLAVSVVCTATIYQRVYILYVISQMERTLKSQL